MKPLIIKTILNAVALTAIVTVWPGCSKNSGPSPAPASPFHNLVVSGACKVNLAAGPVNTIDTSSGALITSVVNGTLFISGAGETTISINDLDSLVANGTSEIIAASTLSFDYLFVAGNGFSKMNLNISATDSLVAVSNGTGPYTLSGNTPRLHLHANGLGSFHAFNLLSKDCEVGLLGAGISEVYASNSLTVFIGGMGTVYYKGNPPTVNKIIAGLGQVIKK